MVSLRLDETGDFVLYNNTLQKIEGSKNTCQRIQNILSSWVREWFLNLGFGIDYFNFFKEKNSYDLLQSAIENRCLEDIEILAVNVEIIKKNNRKIEININATYINNVIENIIIEV